MRSLWSSPRPWSGGIDAAFGPIGAGSPASVVAARRSIVRSVSSSDGWLRRTHYGERRGYTVNCWC